MSTQESFASLNELFGVKEGEESKEMVPVSDEKPNLPSVADAHFDVPVKFKKGAEVEEASGAENDDFDYARRNIHIALEKAQEMMAAALREAKISGHPQVMQAANTAIANVANLSNQLMELHKKESKRLAREAKESKNSGEGKVIVVEKTTLEILRELNAPTVVDAELLPHEPSDN